MAAPPDARPAEEPIRLEYRPVAGCPSKDALISTLRASTPRFRFAAQNEPARSFAIDAEEKPDTINATNAPRYAGRLIIRDVSGQIAVREVTGETCSEAVAALAFVAALAIDPNAVPTAGATVGPSEPPGASPASGAEAPTNPTPPTPIPAVPPPGQPMTSNALAPEVAQARGRAETRFSVALRGGLITGVAPEMTGMGRLSVDLSHVTEGSLWSPSVTLSIARGATQDVPTRAGTAELTWTTGRFEACVLRLPAHLDSRWELRLGPFFEVGLLAGRAPGAREETPKDKTWVAIGAVARVALQVAGPVSLEAETGLSAPISRYNFHFQPEPPVYEVAVVSFSAAAGIAVRFW